MGTLIIALKLIKQNFAQPVNLLIFTAVPVLLILILGTALSGVFSAANEIPEIHLAYHLDSPGPQGEALVNYLQTVTHGSSELFADEAEGLHSLRQGDYQAFVAFNARDSRIDLYLNNAGGISSGIIEAMVRTFIDEYDFRAVLFQDGEDIPLNLNDLDRDFILEKGLNRPKQPDAMDNMGILMISMFVLFGAFMVSYTVENERSNSTFSRIYTAPLSKESLFWGFYLGNFIFMAVMVILNFILAKWLLGVYFGEKIFEVLLILLSEVFLAVSIGVSLAIVIKDSKAVKALTNVVILSFVFFAGGYGPLPDEPFFQTAKLFSPMTWVKESLFELIYGGTYEKLFPAILICFGLGFLFIAFAFVSSARRREL